MSQRQTQIQPDMYKMVGSPRSYRWTALVFAGALTMAAGAAGAQADHGVRVSPEQSALARATCANVMRIKVGVVPFDGCVESLSNTLYARAQGEILAKSYDDCTRTGHKEGTPEFAGCVLDRKAYHNAQPAEASAARVTGPAAANYTESLSAGPSYSESNPEERRRKEEYSCARLGLSPGSSSFGVCVAQLDSALRSVEYSN